MPYTRAPPSSDMIAAAPVTMPVCARTMGRAMPVISKIPVRK